MTTSLVDLNFTTAGDSQIYAAVEAFVDAGTPQPDRSSGYGVVLPVITDKSHVLRQIHRR